MQLLQDIPDSFWGLFRSVNRNTYIEALLKINEEYQYNNYYLSREICIQVLGEYFSRRHLNLEREELETELDVLEPLATRILNWLVKAKWLRKLDDYSNLVTNIVIPDYAAVFIDAFERLSSEDSDDTEVYIQNIYAILFSFNNDKRANVSLLHTALVNARRLNKTLQDMLHNMDKFFESLLEADSYERLLKDHLDGYVEEIVRKKYHILKTSDNFYLYKTDIKHWLKEMQDEPKWMEEAARKNGGMDPAELYGLLDNLERSFDDIEHRIANMDREHTRYVRATVSRLGYLISGDSDMKGMVVRLLNAIGSQDDRALGIRRAGSFMNLSSIQILSDRSLYKPRGPKRDFTEELEPEEDRKELSRDEVLKLNRIHNRYSRRQIEQFIETRMGDGQLTVTEETVTGDDEFEQLILAYDYCMRRDSKYQVVVAEDAKDNMIHTGKYSYPKMMFIRRHA